MLKFCRTVLDSPGLNLRTIFEQSETEFWTVFKQFGNEFLRLFLGSPGTDFRNIIGPCVPCLLLKKLNNMLVV